MDGTRNKNEKNETSDNWGSATGGDEDLSLVEYDAL
jgi:hypothetical protein